MPNLKKTIFVTLAMVLVPFCAFAIDGQVLINNSTVMAAGGYPYVISQPGSYKLSGNLTAPAGVNAIVVMASNSTLDLNGFTVQCSVMASAGSATCITDLGNNAHDTTIRNGSVIATNISPTNSGANFYTLSAVKFASQRMTIEGLRIQMSADPGDAFGDTLDVGPNSILRANIISISGAFSVIGSFVCPSLFIENVLAGVNITFAANLGCILINNIGLH
jgi:hypothetical protein